MEPKNTKAMETLLMTKPGVFRLLDNAISLEDLTEEEKEVYMELAEDVWDDIVEFTILIDGDLSTLLLAGLEAMIDNEINDVLEGAINFTEE